MLRIIIIITLILIAIPLYYKGKDYFSEKYHDVKVIGESVTKAVKYKIKDKDK